MHKRTFLKLSSGLMASRVLAPLTTWAAAERLKNWAGNLEYSTGSLVTARSLQEVQEAVRAHESLRVLGSRHCFNTIADSTSQPAVARRRWTPSCRSTRTRAP